MNEKTADENYVDQFLTRPNEGCNLEFKEAQISSTSRNSSPTALPSETKTGGQIILGVSDKFPRRVCGTRAFPNVEDSEHKIYESLRLKVIVRKIQYVGPVY